MAERDAKQALKEAELALAQAIEREEQLKHDHQREILEVVHDINNPLGAMMSTIVLLKTKMEGAEAAVPLVEVVEILETSTQRLASVCAELLKGVDIKQPEVGGHEEDATVRDVDVAVMITEITELFAAIAGERGIRLSTNISDEFPEIRTVPRDIRRALTNVISNAVKFTPKGGCIVIDASVDKKQDAVVMVVRDTGKGIPAQQIMRILQGRESSISPYGDEGTGLGLAIVTRLIQKMGGVVEISSKENSGTTITLRFPKSIIVPRKKKKKKKKG